MSDPPDHEPEPEPEPEVPASRVPHSPEYWPLYCEENVWQLCGALPAGTKRALVAFISNADRAVAVFHQRSSDDDLHPVLWDYHVILLVEGAAGWAVIDADSTLPSPCPADIYLQASFPALPSELARHLPRFRLVPAGEYRETLASDRSHMRTPDGSWRGAPPPWTCIGEGMNLMRFVDMQSDFVGHVVDLASLRAELGIGTLSA